MYGTLNLQSITLLNSHLLAAFGTHYYLYSTDTQLCLAEFDIGHQTAIICSSIVQQKQKYSLRSLDQTGICIQTAIFFQQNSTNTNQKNFSFKPQSKQSIFSKKQNKKIKQASFINHDLIFFIKQNKKIQSFSVLNSSLSHIAHQSNFSRIINKKQDQYAYLVQQSGQKICIYNKESFSIMKQYQHNAKISSVTNVENILVVGDVRGKITLLYEYLNKNKNKKAQYTSVLQWHTSPVKALSSHGQYLYSAGQESVVVLWHTRDLSRDFLPRIGTSVQYLSIKPQSNQIICGLSDNSIKIIDLSQDKQTSTYKTIIDPRGYAPLGNNRFSPKLTSYYHGNLCLNSLPGKLQFINFNKNGQHTQLEIVSRNIINSISQDKMQPHRVNSFAFSSDWTSVAVSVLSHHNQSYLKFYRRGVQGYQLVNKTQNPHAGQTNSVLFSGQKKNPRFITFSQDDDTIRVWSQHKQKKKSIIDSSEIYWRCVSELKHRNMKITSVNTSWPNLITAVYENKQIFIYHIQQDGSITVNKSITSTQNIKQVIILDQQTIKSKKKYLKLLVVKTTQQLQIWKCQQTKNQQLNIQITEKIGHKQQQELVINCGHKQIAIFLNSQQNTKLIILNRKQAKFTQSYDSDTRLQSAFWIDDRLVLIAADLAFAALDGKPIFKFADLQSNQEQKMIEDIETVLVNDYDIFKMNERWVERQSIKNKKKVQDCVESFEVLPSCASIWEQMSAQLLL